MLRIFLTPFYISFMARLKDPDPFARSGRSPDWPGDVDYRPILVGTCSLPEISFPNQIFLKYTCNLKQMVWTGLLGCTESFVWSTGCRTEMWSLKHVVSEHCQHPQGHFKYYVTTSEICPSDLLVTLRTDRDKGRRTSRPQINCIVPGLFWVFGFATHLQLDFFMGSLRLASARLLGAPGPNGYTHKIKSKLVYMHENKSVQAVVNVNVLIYTYMYLYAYICVCT